MFYNLSPCIEGSLKLEMVSVGNEGAQQGQRQEERKTEREKKKNSVGREMIINLVQSSFSQALVCERLASSILPLTTYLVLALFSGLYYAYSI